MQPSTTGQPAAPAVRSDADHLAHAIRLGEANVADGGGPFGAVVVTADTHEFEGTNRVTVDNDPTAHAEVGAIRRAAAESGTFDLSGSVLYTSCEPCPMCLASALWARVGRVVFAADRYDAASAGFDDAEFYDFFDTPVEDRPMPVKQGTPSGVEATAPFTAWTSFADRVSY